MEAMAFWFASISLVISVATFLILIAVSNNVNRLQNLVNAFATQTPTDKRGWTIIYKHGRYTQIETFDVDTEQDALRELMRRGVNPSAIVESKRA